MKLLALSIGMLLSLTPVFSAQIPVSNVGVISYSRALGENDSRIVLECDTDDVDTLQRFEVAEVTVVLSSGELIKSSLFLSEDKLQIKIGEELIKIGILDLKKNVELEKSIFAEYFIENDHFALKLRLPAVEKSK